MASSTPSTSASNKSDSDNNNDDSNSCVSNPEWWNRGCLSYFLFDEETKNIGKSRMRHPAHGRCKLCKGSKVRIIKGHNTVTSHFLDHLRACHTKEYEAVQAAKVEKRASKKEEKALKRKGFIPELSTSTATSTKQLKLDIYNVRRNTSPEIKTQVSLIYFC